MGYVVVLLIVVIVGCIFFTKHKNRTVGEFQNVHAKIDSANEGNVDDMWWLGMYFMQKQKKDKSLEWFTKAINRGDVRSMKTLSRQYSEAMNSKELGMEGFGYDRKKEIGLLQMAADAGDAEAKEILALQHSTNK
ncbi:MAG: hypothetical protein RSH79_07985 [Clostridiales bacterium]